MDSGIYCFTSPSGKKYIGKSYNVFSRYNGHKENAENGNSKTKFYDACKKYGFENFTFEILEFVDKNKLNDKEKYYIKLHKSNISEFGYNMTEGGDGLDKGQFRLRNLITNIQFIGTRDMISDVVIPATTGYVTAKDKNTNEFCVVTKEDFNNNPNLVGSMKDTITVKNLITNKCERVTREEYNNNFNLVGSSTGMISVFVIDTEEKIYISKDEYKEYKNIKYIKFLRPWHAPKVKSTPNSTYVWSQADKIKEMIDSGLSIQNIAKHYQSKIGYIIGMIKTKDWNPLEDEKWVKDFKL